MVRVEPATVAWLEALVVGDEVFATRFGIPVVPGWAGFPEALPRLLATARADGPSAWGTHLFFDDDGALVGLGGWKDGPVVGVDVGPPPLRLCEGPRAPRSGAWRPLAMGTSASRPAQSS